MWAHNEGMFCFHTLMGQSNMLGAGKVTGDTEGSLEYAVKEKKLYSNLIDDAGNWTVRQDVRNVRVMSSGTGNMKGFNNEWMTITGGNIGPEIGIGNYVGEATDARVGGGEGLGREGSATASQDLHVAVVTGEYHLEAR